MKERENNDKPESVQDSDELIELECDREMAMWRYEHGLDADSTRIGL